MYCPSDETNVNGSLQRNMLILISISTKLIGIIQQVKELIQKFSKLALNKFNINLYVPLKKFILVWLLVKIYILFSWFHCIEFVVISIWGVYIFFGCMAQYGFPDLLV